MKKPVLSLLSAGLLLTLALYAPAVWSQVKPAGQARQDAGDGREVEVRFANGSTVYMTILQDKIEVQTHFGKLTVHPRDINHIDFGVHVPDDVEQKIQSALLQLNSNNYKERDAALKTLVALGPQAYLALHKAAKSKDMEVSQRAQMAIKYIERKVPARQLRLSEEDVIRTTKFTIVGRVVTPAIKARAEYFGDLELKPSQLHSIRWLQGAGETEVVVDAARHGSAHNQWLDSGVHVSSHLDLMIIAVGQVDLWPQGPGQYLAGPSGMAGARPAGVRPGSDVQSAQPGMLVGRIGETGTAFVIGERYAGRPNRDGKLYLHIGPSPWNNASTGSYRVKITTGNNLAEDVK